MADDAPTNDIIALTAEIVSAHVANNSVPANELPNLIKSIHDALSGLGGVAVAKEAPAKPQGATTARKSLANPSHIISMIDGKPYRMLRRHIKGHGHTPESYREAFGLARDYPMTAPDYAEQRSKLARQIGLGRKPSAPAADAKAPASSEPKAPVRRGRKPKAEPAAA